MTPRVSFHLLLRPGVYITILACALLGGLPLYLRTQGIFACPATGYGTNDYLADCRAGAYGDYDHGAFWFGLEPEALRSLAEADVLFVGSSRLQFGFSHEATTAWFAQHSIRHFLFGLSDTETVAFVDPVLIRAQPRAKAVVINVDRFFDDRVSRPTREILNGDGRTKWSYRAKQAWQAAHRRMCIALPRLCGRSTAVYRSRTTGAWQMHGEAIDWEMPVSNGSPEERERWPEFTRLARDFVSRLPVRRDCVVLTVVPTKDTKRAEAEAIAAALGQELVAPEVDGLKTFDGSHLDAESAKRWSSAFLAAAAPRLLDCVGR